MLVKIDGFIFKSTFIYGQICQKRPSKGNTREERHKIDKRNEVLKKKMCINKENI